MPGYGSQIGKKFLADGSAAPYPGNTVVSDVGPGNPAYDVMCACRRRVTDAGLGRLFILLPQDSYHMTVIRGLNHRVRREAYWPARLPADAPMTEADDVVEAAVASVPPPTGLQMRFVEARITEEDFRVCLAPADEAQNAALRRYRDQVAAALGLRLPGHGEYTFHITLAYTLLLPEGGQASQLAALQGEMNALLAAQPPFAVDPPHVAFYRDMLEFSPVPVPRDESPFVKGDVLYEKDLAHR